MEDNSKLTDTILESAIEYGKTSIELAKLKAADRISETASSLLPQYLVSIIIAAGIFLFSFGLAFWLGDILGRLVYGFFAVAGLYGIAAFVLQYFLKERLRRFFSGYIIRKILK
jgi:hypothetical protein